jgi:simple sugar transport system permease protein
MSESAAFPSRVTPLESVSIPGLAHLPVFGPALFSQNALAYAALVLVALVAWWFARTTPGLVLRAAGEAPAAVETAGIDVRRVRILAVLFGGALAGLAGVSLSIGSSDTFVENMSAGRGFVALALVVLARWSPVAGLGACILFGLAMAFQVRFQGDRLFGASIPYHAFQMLPYALTLVVLAAAPREGARAPAALGRPFVRGRE